MANSSVILLVDDDEDHILLTRCAFNQAGMVNPLYVVRDGQEAIAYLEGKGIYTNRAEYPLPSLMLLDLKMPKKNGFEVLEWIRARPDLRSLKIVVLTTSADIHEVKLAYDLGANSFMVKPP